MGFELRSMRIKQKQVLEEDDRGKQWKCKIPLSSQMSFQLILKDQPQAHFPSFCLVYSAFLNLMCSMMTFCKLFSLIPFLTSFSSHLGQRCSVERQQGRRHGLNLVPHLSTVYLKQVTYNFLRLQLIISVWDTVGFTGDSDGKESARNAGKLSSIPGSGRSPGEGNGNPLHYSCLENPMDGGAWKTIAHRLTMSWT